MRRLGVLGRLCQQAWFDSTAEVATSVNQQEVGHCRDTLGHRLHLLGMDSRHREGGGPTNAEASQQGAIFSTTPHTNLTVSRAEFPSSILRRTTAILNRTTDEDSQKAWLGLRKNRLVDEASDGLTP